MQNMSHEIRTPLRPPTKPPMRVLPIPKSLRQIAPRRTAPKLPNNRFHKKAIVGCIPPHVTLATRQKIFDFLPLIIP
jgi:hypothetical protein